jgi:hypothetical protein
MSMRPLLCLVMLGMFAIPAFAEDVLTNQDVVKMSSAGLGEELVIAKIKEAAHVDFRLEVDDLVALKQAGLSELVIHAMLDRNRPAPQEPAARMQQNLGMEVIEVSLKTDGREVPLIFGRGEMSSAGFMGYGATFMNFPGLHSRVRTSDKHPTLLVKSSRELTGGHYFLGKLDSDTKNGVRSLKVLTGRGVKESFGNRGYLSPDPDWTVPYEAIEAGAGLWKITVKGPLEPGEYGWYIGLGFGFGPQSNGMFDFGID